VVQANLDFGGRLEIVLAGGGERHQDLGLEASPKLSQVEFAGVGDHLQPRWWSLVYNGSGGTSVPPPCAVGANVYGLWLASLVGGSA
jgi:hypothetical protein